MCFKTQETSLLYNTPYKITNKIFENNQQACCNLKLVALNQSLIKHSEMVNFYVIFLYLYKINNISCYRFVARNHGYTIL